jgi:DNA-binding transcriptional MerR regulator
MVAKGNRYLIKDLENLTGLKAHTIRVWERRYDLLSPDRTDSNIRHYNDHDLKKILNVNLLYSSGLKISKIACLTDEEIISKAAEIIAKGEAGAAHSVDELIDSILAMDKNAIENILDRLFETKGLIEMYTGTLRPLMIRIGQLWQLDTMNISQEHLFSNTLRDFVIAKTSKISRVETGKKALLFLCEDEEHELPLLLYQYLILDKGWRCVYLGQKVPIEDFEQAYFQVAPDMVVISMIKSTSSKQFKNRLKQLLEIVPEKNLCLSGSNTITYLDHIPKKVAKIHSMSDFVRIFD